MDVTTHYLISIVLFVAGTIMARAFILRLDPKYGNWRLLIYIVVLGVLLVTDTPSAIATQAVVNVVLVFYYLIWKAIGGDQPKQS